MSEKKEILNRIAENFTQIPEEDKGLAAMCMVAYQSGKEAGIAQERKRREFETLLVEV